MANSQPPVLQGPTSKERKYDRQLRLWAAQGQAALESSHILLVNSGPGVVGVETLKNLVLPGIGQFTILDPALVTEADLGVNFFVEEEDLGRSRAETCVKWLQEMNPEVKGHASTEPLETFFTVTAQDQPSPLSPYGLIIVTLPIPQALVEQISQEALKLSTPIFFTHCIGFYSHFTLQLPEFFSIVDTHPDPTSTTDVRILEPWPKLVEFVDQKTKNIDQLDDEQHGHLPWIVILIHCIQKWRASHDGQGPSTYKEKTAFRDFVQSHARTGLPEGEEENFEEAVGAVLKAVNPHAPKSEVKALLSSPEVQNLDPDASSFRIIAGAIHTFYTKHNVLPLPGTVPDMKAMSDDYVQLQNVFKAKARADVAEVLENVRKIETSLGRSDPRTHISEADVAAFCKSAAHVRVIQGRPAHFARAEQGLKDRAKAAASAISMPDSLMGLHVAFLAWDRYCDTHGLAGRPIGIEGTSIPDDHDTATAKVTGIAHTYMDAIIKEAGTFIEDPEYSDAKDAVEQICEELVRANGAEMHNIAALTGGMVAQEVIKVITQQYVPVDNTCLYDGIQSKTAVLRL